MKNNGQPLIKSFHNRFYVEENLLVFFNKHVSVQRFFYEM